MFAFAGVGNGREGAHKGYALLEQFAIWSGLGACGFRKARGAKIGIHMRREARSGERFDHGNQNGGRDVRDLGIVSEQLVQPDADGSGERLVGDVERTPAVAKIANNLVSSIHSAVA